MWQKLILIFLLWSSVSAQSFFYSYIDPCQQTVIRSNYTITGDQKGFQVTYYNRTKFFTLEEALEEMHMVAEGVRATRMFCERAEDDKIDIPFTKALNTLLDGHIDAEECCRRMVNLH